MKRFIQSIVLFYQILLMPDDVHFRILWQLKMKANVVEIE